MAEKFPMKWVSEDDKTFVMTKLSPAYTGLDVAIWTDPLSKVKGLTDAVPRVNIRQDGEWLDRVNLEGNPANRGHESVTST